MSVFPTSRRWRSGSLTPGGDRNRWAVAVAMAMFDREQLIKIGGYDTELYKLGWFGWEDYDLWLRIAGAGLCVSFLPNVLCLYRHHEKAMSNTTNLFECELVTHLFDKHRALIEKYPPKRRILGLNRSRFEEAVETITPQHERQPLSIVAEYPAAEC